MRKLKLHRSCKFRDGFVCPFVILERIGEIAYMMDLSSHADLRGVHNAYVAGAR